WRSNARRSRSRIARCKQDKKSADRAAAAGIDESRTPQSARARARPLGGTGVPSNQALIPVSSQLAALDAMPRYDSKRRVTRIAPARGAARPRGALRRMVRTRELLGL